MSEKFETFKDDFDEQWAAMKTALYGSEAWQRVGLKKVYHSPAMSEETECFNASVTFDGKVVGEAQNRGEGGNTNVRIPEEQVNWIDSMVPTQALLETPWQKLEALVDQKFEEWVRVKVAKGVLKKFSVIDTAGAVWSWPVSTKEFLAWPKNKQDSWVARCLERHPGATVLATLTTEQGIDALRSAS